MSLNITSLVIGIVGFIVGIIGIYLTIRFRKVKSPICLYENTTLEPKELKLPEDVKVLYGGKEIKRFTRTRLILWNKGREPIKHEDIREPIKLNFSGEVLGAVVRKRTKDSTKFEVSREEITQQNKILISFDFLDYRDGALFDVFHTGDERTKPNFEGAILGIHRGIVINNLRPESKIFYNILGTSTLLSILFGSLITLFILHKLKIPYDVLKIPFYTLSGLYILCFLFFFYHVYCYGLLPWRPYPKSLHLD